MKFKESSKKIMSMFLVGIMIFTTILNIPLSISHGENIKNQISVEENTDIKKEENKLEKENIEEIKETEKNSLQDEKEDIKVNLEEKEINILNKADSTDIEATKEDSLIKAENKIVYIVTDKDETSTKEKYKQEFGEVIVVRNFKDSIKNTNDGKDLIVISEIDLIDIDKINKIPKELKSFYLEGRKDGNIGQNIAFNTEINLNSVDSRILNLGTSIVKDEDYLNLDDNTGILIVGDPKIAEENINPKLVLENSNILDLYGFDMIDLDSDFELDNIRTVNISLDIKKSSIGKLNSMEYRPTAKDLSKINFNIDFNMEDSKACYLYTGLHGGYWQNLNGLEESAKISAINFDEINIKMENNMITTDFNLLKEGSLKQRFDIKVNKMDSEVNNLKFQGRHYSGYDYGSISLIKDGWYLNNAEIKDLNLSFKNIESNRDFTLIKLQEMIDYKNKPKDININFGNFKLDIDKIKVSELLPIGYVYKNKTVKEMPKTTINFDKDAEININDITVNNNTLINYIYGLDTKVEDVTQNGNINYNISKINSTKEKPLFFITSSDNISVNGKIDYLLDLGDGKVFIPILDLAPRENDEIIESEALETYLYIKANDVVFLGEMAGVDNLTVDMPVKMMGWRIGNKTDWEILGGKKATKVTLSNRLNDGAHWTIGTPVVITTQDPINENIAIKGDELIQAWPVFPDENDDANAKPPYIMEYFTPDQIGTHAWVLGADVVLHGNSGQFLDGYDYKHLKVFSKDTKILDYHDEEDKNNNIIPVHPDGLEFIGWTIAIDGNLEEDENKRIDFDKETVFTKNLHIYAKWKEEEKVKVDFDTNGGSKVESQEIVKGETATKPTDPSKENHKFIGWYKDEALTEEFNFESPVEENMTLYAKWEENEKPVEDKFKVTFDANGGKFSDNEKLNIITDIVNGDKLTKEDIKTPKRSGYRFKGWYKLAEPNKFYTEEDILNTEIKEDKYVYAKWTKKSTGGGGGDTTPPTKPEETVNIDYVILANGDKYTDVLTATVLGNEIKAPILLTKTNYMDKDTKDEIKRLNPKNIIISGGDGSVSEKLVRDLKDSGYKVERLSGVDRYETAREIANRVRSLSGVKDKVTLVDGTNFPDVITISTYSSIKHAPILLTEPESLNNITKKALADFNISNITIGGESASVSENIEKFLKTSYQVERIGGHDRYETASLIAKEVRNITGNKDDLILVDGTNFPDGITINSLAGKYHSPIHLTNPNRLEDITKKDILDFNIKNILIGGGEASVSANTENYLKGKNINTERISGSDRYKTAVKISEKFTEK